MTIEITKQTRCFGGTHLVYRHDAASTNCSMRFAVYLPPGVEPSAQSGAPARRVPVLYFLSGLTCSEENFTTKAGAQRYAAEQGLALVVPDTSPRGAAVPDEPGSDDFGIGAGFYLNATESPWSTHYRMEEYITQELPALLRDLLPIDPERSGVFGHSMGGHGALVLGMKYPHLFRSISAFAPIVTPSRVPWGQKAFRGYLGPDEAVWREHDATELLQQLRYTRPLLIDQGDADPFLELQLEPERFIAACRAVGTPLSFRRHAGYDHGYFFIASFVGDHVAWHAERLRS